MRLFCIITRFWCGRQELKLFIKSRNPFILKAFSFFYTHIDPYYKALFVSIFPCLRAGIFLLSVWQRALDAGLLIYQPFALAIREPNTCTAFLFSIPAF